jgi:flavin prenyltransferase
VTEAGGIIAPPVPAFYTAPSSLDDVVTQSVARALDLFGLDLVPSRWRAEELADVAE